MRDAIFKWVFVLAGAFLIGPLCGALMAGVAAIDGGHQATALVGHSVASGVLRTLGALALAGALGVIASRRCGVGVGLFSAGLAVVWAAARSGTVVGVLNATRDGDSLTSLAIEGLGIVVVGGAILWAMFRLQRTASTKTLSEKPLLNPESLYAIAAAVLAGGFAAWFVAREGTKGQSIAAAAAAGAVGATVARVIAPEAARWVIAAAPLLLGVLGPIAAIVLHKDQVLDAAFSNRLLSLAYPAPLDWLAGTLLGAPLGLSWAASILHGRLEQVETPGSAASASA